MIMDISEGSHNQFGKIIIVKANPVETIFGMKQYSDHICSDTDYFFFPDQSLLIENILSIARRRDVWRPNETEYTIESVNDENNKKKINVYFHDSLYEVDYNEDEECMKYYCMEYSLNQRDFIRLAKKDEWKFSTESIETPYGDIFLESYMKVNQGPLVGVQFEVDGTLDLSNFDASLEFVDIKAVAVMRRPHNVWLWIYMFDEDHNNVITFCGHDDIDGFAAYVRLLDEL